MDGTISSSWESGALYEATIVEANLDWLKQMKQMCEENGVRLVLIKVPATENPQYYTGTWTRMRSEAAGRLAEALSLDFLDLFYDVDLGIDWTKDTIDGGMHI